MDPYRLNAIVAVNKTVAEENTQMVQDFISKHSSIAWWIRPGGGPIGFIQFTRGGKPVDDVALCTRLLDKKATLLVPGNKCFGNGRNFPGYVRFGFGVDTPGLKAGLAQLEDFIEKEWDSLPLKE